MKFRAIVIPLRVRSSVCRVLMASALAACGSGKRPATSLTDADRRALDDYEQIRAALAADDAKGAKKAAVTMVAHLTPADPKAPAPPLLGPASGVADAQALDTMRQRFEKLSDSVVPMVRGIESYYVMTSDLPNTVPWVQRTKEVDNPFFGKAMHGVGELSKSAP